LALEIDASKLSVYICKVVVKITVTTAYIAFLLMHVSVWSTAYVTHKLE